MTGSLSSNLVLIALLTMVLTGTAAGGTTATLAAPDAVPLPALDIEILREGAAIQAHLRRNVFPDWDGILPPTLLIGPNCQWVVNFGPKAPAGFVTTGQSLSVGRMTHPQVYSRRNTVRGPETLEIDFIVPAIAQTYGSSGQRPWMIMSTYECFKRDFHDSLGFYLAMLAHETFHPFAFRQRKLGRRMEPLSKATFTQFHKAHPDFAQAIRGEMVALRDAILSADLAAKHAGLAVFFSLREKRRKQWLTDATRTWLSEEALVETVEGTAEYMSMRFRMEAAQIPHNPQLGALDPTYDHYREFNGFTLAKAIDDAFRRPSYVQNLGLLEIILLAQLQPTWYKRIFTTDGFGEALLRDCVPPGSK